MYKTGINNPVEDIDNRIKDRYNHVEDRHRQSCKRQTYNQVHNNEEEAPTRGEQFITNCRLLFTIITYHKVKSNFQQSEGDIKQNIENTTTRNKNKTSKT